jgi:hypothetical protein
MQNVAHLFNSSEEYSMNVVEFPEIETAYDKVGVYDQDAVNGFSEQMLTTMLDIINPGQASNILDAMAGNGNLTLRLYDLKGARDLCRGPDLGRPKLPSQGQF